MKVSLFKLLSLAALCIFPRSLSAAVVYFAGTGHWYEAVKVPTGVTWPEAYTNALNRGGYLCTIANSSENDFAASLVDITYYSGVSVNGDILGPWLGGLRHANGSWQWVTGEPWSYTRWYPGQPDGYGGSEQRLQFYARATAGATWGDHPGTPITGFSLPRGYIVEYDVKPVEAYTIDWWTVDGGGGTSFDSRYTLTGTIGQPDAGQAMTNGQYSVVGGFWVIPVAVQVEGAPTLAIVPGAPGYAVLSWTPNTPGFILQESPDLSGSNWSNAPSGSQNPVTVPASSPAKYYRLHKP